MPSRSRRYRLGNANVTVASLVSRVNRREVELSEAQIREFLATDYARVVNAMALVSGSFPAAEDAVQEALGRAWEMTERGRHIESLTAWLTAVARNLLRDRFRRLLVERRARTRMPGAFPTEGAEAVERRADLERALAALPRRQREVAVFRYYLDLEVAEVAGALGIPEGTVKSALHRARASLARALREQDETVVEVGNDAS
ncbi:MAG: sigma-70 family RNA polymerase sigma factor [Actinomycetota bacterium]|nr:sigma-70 family RNA polymerase sigma factor [Actinomycetota bacterium]